ncbi:hypothetical protein [Halodurantibacterium flavum]|uniref:Uncharacterized protein n=1 Tax=Halodurantibacterium flavum TaxID=1382802 RepID=A0ABW4S3G3_9RHOB
MTDQARIPAAPVQAPPPVSAAPAPGPVSKTPAPAAPAPFVFRDWAAI